MPPMPTTATEIAARVRSGDCRARDTVERALAAIAGDPHFAFCGVRAEAARREAELLDARRARGFDPGPLAGVPLAIKDNLLLEGEIAACGSRMLEGFCAPYTATAVARLQANGAIVVGRTNMDEFGMGSSTERSAFGPTRNPWRPTHVPGGSSGGAAAAIAADLVPLALGSDTGGSVRQPAALCGVSGLKPTYGRISRSGLVAYASSLDCVGVLARSAEDLALVRFAAGPDPADATALADPLPPVEFGADARGLEGLRLAVLTGLPEGSVEAGVAACFEAAIAACEHRGAGITRVALTDLDRAVACYYLLACAEASSNLARYDGVRFGLGGSGRTLDQAMADARTRGFGAEVQLRILLGTFALQSGHRNDWYGQASRHRDALRADFARLFADADLVASPTSPIAAFPLGARTADPLSMYAADALTVPASLAGLPALSLPCGFTPEGLPVGMQWVAPARAEGRLLTAAAAYQRATDWHLRRPGS